MARSCAFVSSVSSNNAITVAHFAPINTIREGMLAVGSHFDIPLSSCLKTKDRRGLSWPCSVSLPCSLFDLLSGDSSSPSASSSYFRHSQRKASSPYCNMSALAEHWRGSCSSQSKELGQLRTSRGRSSDTDKDSCSAAPTMPSVKLPGRECLRLRGFQVWQAVSKAARERGETKDHETLRLCFSHRLSASKVLA